MKAIIVIDTFTQNEIEWKFNQALACLTFDVDLHLVFISKGIKSLNMKQWKTIKLYSENNLLILKRQRSKVLVDYELDNLKCISIGEFKTVSYTHLTLPTTPYV